MTQVIKWILQILSNPAFEIVALPILVALFAALLKCLVRGGRAVKFEFAREDLLIGFDLGGTAILMALVFAVRAAERYRSLQVEIQTGLAAQKSDLVNSLTVQANNVFDCITALPVFTFLAFMSLIVLAIVVSQKGWNTTGSTRELSKGWIAACDIGGIIFLAGVLALGGEIR